MEMNVERFLALTALLAAAGTPRCTIINEASDGGVAATGAGGTAAPSPGATDSAAPTTDSGNDDAATGDTGVMSDGGGADGASEAGQGQAPPEASADVSADAVDSGAEATTAPCLGDTNSLGLTDPQSQASMCEESLTGSNESCDTQTYYDCINQAWYLRSGVFAKVLDCLRGVVADPAANSACETYIAKSEACVTTASAAACAAVLPADAGQTCATVAASCPARGDGAPGVAAQQCERALAPFRVETVGAILDCYQLQNAAYPEFGCDTNFHDCVSQHGNPSGE